MDLTINTNAIGNASQWTLVTGMSALPVVLYGDIAPQVAVPGLGGYVTYDPEQANVRVMGSSF